MIDFKKILERVLKAEGYYSNDPADAGGETVRGIARRFNPDWKGWSLVDAWQGDPPKTDGPEWKAIDELVVDFYRIRYWNPIRGDELHDRSVASEIFDAAVNLGVARASAMLQEALNLLNRNGKSWPEILEDGQIGPKTLATVKTCIEPRFGAADLVRVLQVLRGMHYVEITRRRPSQERFLRGWLRRLH